MGLDPTLYQHTHAHRFQHASLSFPPSLSPLIQAPRPPTLPPVWSCIFPNRSKAALQLLSTASSCCRVTLLHPSPIKTDPALQQLHICHHARHMVLLNISLKALLNATSASACFSCGCCCHRRFHAADAAAHAHKRSTRTSDASKRTCSLRPGSCARAFLPF